MDKKEIEVGSDFSGVGAFDQALMLLGIPYNTVFSCDMDKYARKSYIANYGEPKYYPENVYDREIPTTPLDIYMTSPPCQAFSMAGKRKGEDDEKGRGILFYNSHEFIKKNKPRFFIFENVKGLLSHDRTQKGSTYGKTFMTWVNYLGGKSVNGNPVVFPHEEAVPYHIYFTVLNTKNFGIPQNRERVFIVGIRDDEDNNFTWPQEVSLSLRLRDILEPEVDEKYLLSEEAVKRLTNNDEGFHSDIKTENDIASCHGARDYEKLARGMNIVRVKSATKKGYEEAKEGDSINFSVISSETRRGRVGKGVAQTLDTACNQATISEDRIRRLTPLECFRLQGFPDQFVHNCLEVGMSDTQLYKQAGNSITREVLAAIISKLQL